ncbi:MAG: ribosomal RNA small subunit methyltransferase A [Candidatus Pacebacteria bacterium]|nr:ribosomal RNA small subunit methyltransferase A [Candidatus Paceibacterota bacterium]
MGRRLGQHFLKNEAILEKIARIIEPCENMVVIEIGSGTGQLTKHIIERFKNARIKKWQLVCIEKDKALIPALKENIKGEYVKIINQDALDVFPLIASSRRARHASYVVIGNIPYYITGSLLRVIGDAKVKPTQTIALIQEEVASRLTVRPPKMNMLAASVQYWGVPRKKFIVAAGNFNPPPKVSSAVIEIIPRVEKARCAPELFYKCMRAVFKQPRKMAVSNLAQGGYEREKIENVLRMYDLSKQARPQDLSVELIEKIATQL